MNRRELLGRAGAVLGALVVLKPQRTPEALTIEEVPPRSALGLSYTSHCGGPAEHAGLLGRLQKQLARLTGDPGKRLTATATCPICGCSVTATRTVK
jgi:hypothetical protein